MCRPYPFGFWRLPPHTPSTPDEQRQILRLNILDTPTGLSVFEKVWKWDGVETSEGVEALIRSFYQFSREIDDGEIQRVQFALPSSNASSRKHGRQGRRRPRGGDGGGIADSLMGMICERRAALSVVLFHGVELEREGAGQGGEGGAEGGGGGDPDGMRTFAQAVHVKFESMFRDMLGTDEMRRLLRCDIWGGGERIGGG